MKPGGLFLFTVPYGRQKETTEHFPDLHEFALIENNGTYLLRNRTKEGAMQEFDNLVFHGGLGSTLEMRIFSEDSLLAHLRNAGFCDIKVHHFPDLTIGAWWPEPWSFPITAKKPFC